MVTNGKESLKSKNRVQFEGIVNHKVKDINKKVIKYDTIRLNFYNKKHLEPRVNIYMVYQGFLDNKSIPMHLYIGKTRQSLKKRLSQHVSEVKAALKGKKEWSLKLRWMYMILKGKNNLSIILLNRVQKSKGYKIEQEWITYLRLHGFDLMNRDNSKHIKNNIYYE